VSISNTLDKNNEGLLREAINDLFVKYGKPPIGDLDDYGGAGCHPRAALDSCDRPKSLR
jgi:hypothetical protein